MKAVFYDLETSDKNFVGQIINYAFLLVDESFAIQEECCGRVRLSRLQLPSPEAIIANKTDIVIHQRDAEYNEKEALSHIWKFLRKVTAESREPICLIGYNSSRFDLPYIRTSFIRNGLNPYFPNMIYGDLLHLSKKLYMTHKEFPQVASLRESMPGEAPHASLSLEALCRHFGILDGAQAHESRADVVLTIDLAKIYQQKFDLNVFTYQSYEAQQYHSPGNAVCALYPLYELGSATRAEKSAWIYHQGNHKYSLWINLRRYQKGEGRRAIQWIKHQGDALFIEGAYRLDESESSAAAQARNEFSEITIFNFFSRSLCDIEQDIYRIDFQMIELLRLALWERNTKPLHEASNPDLEALLQRHSLIHYSWGSNKDDRVREALAEYALYRYGGRMMISKSGNPEDYQEGVFSKLYHETYSEYCTRIEAYKSHPSDQIRTLMISLDQYYQASDIIKVAGEKLMKIQRVMPEAADPVEQLSA